MPAARNKQTPSAGSKARPGRGSRRPPAGSSARYAIWKGPAARLRFAMQVYGSCLLLQIGAKILRQVVAGSQLARLARAQLGDNGPAILHRNIGRIRAHQVTAVGNHEELLSVRHFHDALIVEI